MDLNLQNESFSPRSAGGQQPRSKVSRYLLAGGLLAGGITLGALASPIGLAGATSDDTGTSDDNSGTADGSAAKTDGATSENRHGHRHHRGGIGLGGPLDDLSDTLGLSAEELREQLTSGSSLADIAEAQGVDIETLTEALLAGVESHLDDAVTDGKIDQVEADKRLSQAGSRIDGLINRTMPVPDGPGFAARFGPGHGLGELSDELGISAEDVTTGLKDGKTLVEIGADAGVSEQELVDALVDHMTKRIDAAVADEKLDADRAEELKADLPERVAEMVNHSPGEGPFGHGRGGFMAGGDRVPGMHGPRGHADSGDGGPAEDGATQQSSFPF